jgi:Protein of unknown function (DUF2933)
MTLLFAIGFSGLFALVFVLVCPLMMLFMMRGMHGHGSQAHHDGEQMTLDELKRERDALNEQIAERAEQVTDERRQTVSP